MLARVHHEVYPAQVVVVICHCCVSELTASTLHGDCTADQRLLDLAKASYPFLVCVTITTGRKRRCVARLHVLNGFPLSSLGVLDL